MLKEHDVIKAKRKLSDKVDKGSIGTIVMLYRSPKLAYEIEFIDKDGQTVEILTVTSQNIESTDRFKASHR